MHVFQVLVNNYVFCCILEFNNDKILGEKSQKKVSKIKSWIIYFKFRC